MSRVHCTACGTSVAVDPTGLCPDGHHVGAAGARVAQLMGSGAPHVDEPEPWIAQVVLDDDPGPTADVPRRARPVSVPGNEVVDDADQESLLQELHALAGLGFDGLDDATATSAPSPAPTSVPAAPATSAPPPAAPAHEPTPPSLGEPGSLDPSRGDELAALEAALHELSLPADETPTPPPAHGVERDGRDADASIDGLAGLDELDALFAAAPAATHHYEPRGDDDAAPAAPRPHLTIAASSAAVGATPPTASPASSSAPRTPEPSPPASETTDAATSADRAGADTADAAPTTDAASTTTPTPTPPTPLPAPTPPPTPAGLDISNFTAKGGRVGGRKRRFGR